MKLDPCDAYGPVAVKRVASEGDRTMIEMGHSLPMNIVSIGLLR